MYILVTYDVDTTDKSGQRRLRRVAKACLDYGQRVQNSVFECELTDVQFCILKERINEIIDLSLDSIRFYHLNRSENRRVEVMGVETAFNVNDAIIIQKMWIECDTYLSVFSHQLIISYLDVKL